MSTSSLRGLSHSSPIKTGFVLILYFRSQLSKIRKVLKTTRALPARTLINPNYSKNWPFWGCLSLFSIFFIFQTLKKFQNESFWTIVLFKLEQPHDATQLFNQTWPINYLSKTKLSGLTRTNKLCRKIVRHNVCHTSTVLQFVLPDCLVLYPFDYQDYHIRLSRSRYLLKSLY